ncbi:MAG: hypothetical protein HDQ96_11970 [Lachnospiraceae bacterium]|nr:hypothetical protein [Lachnospiraceae bacterium]
MTELLLVKETVKTFVGKYEVYLKPLGKFLLAFAALFMINKSTGYMDKLNSMSLVLVVALLCSFMPLNFSIICAAAFIILHLYALSMECALVALILFLILALVYFRFAPKDAVIVLLLPMCFYLKIPYVIPVCAGLLATPVSAVSVACGVIVYYMVSYVAGNVSGLSALEAEDMSGRFRYVVDGFLKNKTMAVVMVAFAVTVIIVYLIRRLSIDHSWTIAIVTGTITQMVVLLLGALMMDADVSMAGIIIGSLVSAGIACVVEFIMFQMDYSRAEQVQFEDDEYYYYVKAVPKVMLSKPEKTVKKINTQRKKKRSH